MLNKEYDVIVIGAGQAGLSVSYFLRKHGLSHIIFERGKVGESWRSQRWDSFTINTPAWINSLPGDVYNGDEPDRFYLTKEFISYLDDYSKRNYLPVVENANVVSLDRSNNGDKFVITVSTKGSTTEYQCSKVVIASGIMNKKNIPSISQNISPDIFQLHTADYRNPFQLPPGAALVAGSAQSGCQVTEDLLKAGRIVYLSTSKVPRVPRRYRGKDILYWMKETGFLDVETQSVTDPMVFRMRQPQVSGLGPFGHTVSLQFLAREGTVILGKLDSAEGDKVYFQPNAAEHVRFADEFSKKFKNSIDEYIMQNGLNFPEPEHDAADEPDPEAKCTCEMPKLNLRENNITSIVWTTGYGSDFSWVKLPVIDDKGNPKHFNGISDVDGVYFLGFPWLRKRKSGIIAGIAEDAEFIAGKIVNGSYK